MLWKAPISQCPRLLGCSSEYLKLALLFGNYSKPEMWLHLGNKTLKGDTTSEKLTYINNKKQTVTFQYIIHAP
jgi:hypothetical protein